MQFMFAFLQDILPWSMLSMFSFKNLEKYPTESYTTREKKKKKKKMYKGITYTLLLVLLWPFQ